MARVRILRSPLQQPRLPRHLLQLLLLRSLRNDPLLLQHHSHLSQELLLQRIPSHHHLSNPPRITNLRPLFQATRFLQASRSRRLRSSLSEVRSPEDLQASCPLPNPPILHPLILPLTLQNDHDPLQVLLSRNLHIVDTLHSQSQSRNHRHSHNHNHSQNHNHNHNHSHNHNGSPPPFFTTPVKTLCLAYEQRSWISLSTTNITPSIGRSTRGISPSWRS